MSSTTIFKKDTKGRIRQLEIWASRGFLYQKSGLVGGKMVTHSKLCKAKNIGKTNYRSAEDQAVAQKDALIAKKLRKDYFTTDMAAKASNIILPMLAYDYFKHTGKITKSNMALQPKLDGVRCLMFYNATDKTIVAKTRENVVIKHVDHIKNELLTTLKNQTDDIILDGELYMHGKTFQEVTKLIKNKPTNEFIEYHVYDLVDATMQFGDRSDKVHKLLNGGGKYVDEVLTIFEVLGDLRPYFEMYLIEGYEGMMIRDITSLYKISGRSDKLLKYKDFIDITLPIQDITPNEANAMHGTVWVTFNGHLQKTGTRLSHADREELLINRDSLIGEMAEIRYFEETDEGKMRLAVYHGLRMDK